MCTSILRAGAESSEREADQNRMFASPLLSTPTLGYLQELVNRIVAVIRRDPR